MGSGGRGPQSALCILRQAKIELFAACGACGHSFLLPILTLTILPDNVKTTYNGVGLAQALERHRLRHVRRDIVESFFRHLQLVANRGEHGARTDGVYADAALGERCNF
jgi:hypothetical protein